MKKIFRMEKEVFVSRMACVVPIIHFLLTFWLERKRFIFENNFDFVNEIPRNNYVSNEVELVITYILSKLCAAIIIFLLWKGIFGIFRGRVKRNTAVLFLTIFAIGAIVGLIVFPNMFYLSTDNNLTYAQAIRFLPTYWQSIYTGAVYAGCMMVFPHPYMIFFFQWMAYVGVISYIYTNIEKTFNAKKLKYVSLILFVLPEAYLVVFEAYRNNFYTILCMFYFSYLFFILKNRETENKISEMLTMVAMSAFLAVWRSEGILIGFSGMVVLFFVYKVKWKRAMLLGVTFFGVFWITSTLQDIGAQKYYGKDYVIINTTDVLYNIFNDPNANFVYEGAEEDLAAIEAVIPVQILKESGTTGYRNYNWTEGRDNFNQTLADDETAERYMSAYYRIILNNVTTYLNVQGNSFFGTLQVNLKYSTNHYSGTSYTELSSFNYYRWLTGSSDLRDTWMTSVWEKNETKIFLTKVIEWFMKAWRDLWVASGLLALVHVSVLMADILLFTYKVINLILEKEKKQIGMVVLFLIIIGEFMAIFLFMPVIRPAYLYPMLYSSYLLLFYAFAEKKFGLRE